MDPYTQQMIQAMTNPGPSFGQRLPIGQAALSEWDVANPAAPAPVAPQAPKPNDALLQQLIQAGQTHDRMNMLAPQMSRAQALMSTPSAEGMRVGGTYRAASPLEHLATALSRMKGNSMMGDVQQQMGGMLDKQGAGRMAYAQNGAPPMLGALSGDPAMAAAGQEQMQEQARQTSAQQFKQKLDMETAQRQAEAAHWQAQHDLESRRADETARHNSQTEATQRALLGGGAGGGALSGDALDMAATLYARTGQLPSLGRSPAGRTAIITRAAQMFPGSDIAGNKATLDADKKSLSSQQHLLDLTTSWEKTGKANLGVLRETAKQLADSGSPLLNKPLRWLMQNAAGDPNVAKFKAAHAAVVNEYAKILSGNTGGGGITEGARHEAEAMFPLDSTLGQIAAASDILESDAGNRLSALASQVDATKARIAGGPGGVKPAMSEEDKAAKAWATSNPNDPRAAQIMERLKAKGL